jgi:hypothetical protein
MEVILDFNYSKEDFKSLDELLLRLS